MDLRIGLLAALLTLSAAPCLGNSPEEMGRTIGEDGALTLSFTAGNLRHEYHYENSGEGLVLAR